ncbi:MAG TPA: hypothetical protein VNN21_04240, partial [Dehalococcoidia bacterium]|nr:hypothetical protein [Dehalococcoidia bacterium]
MAVTVTGLQIAQLLVERRGLGLYIASNQSTIAAGSVTSAYYFANSNWGGNELLSRNAGFWGPENTTGLADDWRPAGTLTASNGAVAISPNFTDTTARNLYCLYHGIHPQFIIDACNQALRDVYTPALEPLCIKPASTVTLDAGFQNSATTSWTESDADGGPATTFSKVSTADSDVVYPGMIRAGLIVNTQAGGYIRQRFNMTEGDTFNVFALSRLASGTNAELVLRDVTNAAAIGSTVEHDQGSWQWMRRVGEVVPDGSKLVEVRLQGEGASDNVYWQALCVYPQRARVIELATTWDTSYKLPSLL